MDGVGLLNFFLAAQKRRNCEQFRRFCVYAMPMLRMNIYAFFLP
jgi:hypothetical protein